MPPPARRHPPSRSMTVFNRNSLRTAMCLHEKLQGKTTTVWMWSGNLEERDMRRRKNASGDWRHPRCFEDCCEAFQLRMLMNRAREPRDTFEDERERAARGEGVHGVLRGGDL